MTSTYILAASMTSAAIIISAIIAKYGVPYFFKRNSNLPKVEGKWEGMSIYLPINHFHTGSECLYDVQVSLIHEGNERYSISENISKVYDFYGNDLHSGSREIKGSGKRVRTREFIFDFEEAQTDTSGTIYLFADSRYKQLSGFVSLKNPYHEVPLTNQIILTREGGNPVTREQLPIEAVNCLIAMHKNTKV